MLNRICHTVIISRIIYVLFYRCLLLKIIFNLYYFLFFIFYFLFFIFYFLFFIFKIEIK